MGSATGRRVDSVEPGERRATPQSDGLGGFRRAGRVVVAPEYGSDTDVLSAELICNDFVVNGSGSAFTLNYEPDDRSHLTGVGLVE